MADNLAFFPYQMQDEPLFVIHQIDIIVSVSGSNLMQSFREVSFAFNFCSCCKPCLSFYVYFSFLVWVCSLHSSCLISLVNRNLIYNCAVVCTYIVDFIVIIRDFVF